MANAQDFVKLAVDAHRGIGDAAKYSKSEVQGALRDFLVEQFGSTKLDARALRNCDPKTFALVEEVIQKELNDYWTNNEIVNRIVEYRNLALGDEQEFYVQEDELLAVASIAEGSTHIRRQRIEGGRTFTIPTEVRGIKVYEELIRVMSGRVDFNHLIDVAVASSAKDAYERQMKAWDALDATSKDSSGNLILGSTYYKTGSYNEATLLDLIAEVEAETNQTATIYGTKKALRTIAYGIDKTSGDMRNEINNQGYLGRFFGTDCVALRQTHKADGTMLLNDSALLVVASGEKPIKYVTEGDGFILQKDPTSNADLTYEWLYTERNGVGLVVNEKFGKYVMA